MIKKYFTALICILVICGISVFSSKSFSQVETPEPPPEELIKEMLADEELPEEIREELEEMLRREEIGEAEEVPAEISPAEEEMEEAEETESERSGNKPTKAKIASSDESNKISLDLKGVDIIDVLKMLSARSNLNIVAGRNVRGRVTLFLKDVDVWDAFEIILAANDLAYEKERNIINVMTERDYEQLYGERYYSKKVLRIYKLEYAKAADISKVLNLAKSKIGKIIVDEGSNTIVLIDSYKAISAMGEMIAEMDMPIETRIFSLNYAKAEDVKEKLSDILTKGVGTVQDDERTNKLVITDLTKKMPEITNVIEEMDEKHKVVLIEAKIVEISLQNEYKYGVDWRMAFKNMGEQGIRFSFDNIGNIVSTGSAGAGIALASIGSRNIDGILAMLQKVGKTNVISCPRITVLNNEEAKVLVGTQQPYVESTTTVTDQTPVTSEVVKYIDVGIELTVTPTINKDGYVTMKIKPEISSLGEGIETAHGAGEGATGNLIYPISTSETETTVMVKDGHTILIAGLIQDRDVSEEDKIPFLGDIPFIGNLFKKKTFGSEEQPEKKELVIFLTPHIIHGTETFPEAENVWYGDTVTQRELLEQQMSMAVEGLQRRRSLFIEPRLPKEEKDTTLRFSEGFKWFERKEGVKKREEKRVEFKEKAEPVKERGTIPEKVVTREEWEEEELEPEEEELEREKAVVPTALIAPPISGYYNYFENVRNRIFWVAKNTYPMGFKGSEDVEILFTLTNEGRLKSEPEVLNGVDRELAKAAKSAVEKAAPFPPFPRRMDKDEESFKVIITYQ